MEKAGCTKQFDMKKLLVRCRAILRMSRAQAETRFGAPKLVQQDYILLLNVTRRSLKNSLSGTKSELNFLEDTPGINRN